MAGISSEALNSDPVNRKKFNGGTEIESNDFLDGSGLEIYSTRFRSLDPQLGKFLQIDALEGLALSASPFSYAGNNPVSFNDPLGLSWKDSIRTASGDYAYANNPDLANITISGGIRKRSVNFIYWPQIHKGQTEWNNEMYARQRDGKMLITGSEPDWVLKDLAFHKRNYQSYQD
jgi:RHS repeat-associated protein